MNLIYQQNPISGCSVCWKRLGWLAGLGVASSPPPVALVLGDPVCGGGLLELACWLVQPQPQPAISSQANRLRDSRVPKIWREGVISAAATVRERNDRRMVSG